jgi:Caspase domain
MTMTIRTTNRFLFAVALGLAVAGRNLSADASVQLPADQMGGMPSLAAVMDGSAQAGAERRVALVVGNGTYNATYMSLPNPRNDAEDISAVLKDLDFKVVTAINATKRELELKLEEFARLAIDADAALFFYAGHAMQYQGRNYLMPTDAEVEDEFSIRSRTVGMEDVDDALERVNGVKIVILDACRNNPLANRLQTSIAGASRSVAMTRGLARIDKTEGKVIAYATAPDDVANDGQDRNSPFTAALLKRLREPGIEIGIMLRRVAADVYDQTRGRQRPEYMISLLSEYSLNQNDRIAWERINKDDVAALRDFMRKYYSSPLAIQALNRVDLLERNARERDERRRQDELKRIAEEQSQKEERKRIAALPMDAPVTKGPPVLLISPGVTAQPQATKANPHEQIRRAQTELKRLGCFDGKLNGNMDTTTEKAIKAYGKHSNKPVVEININDDFIADLQRRQDDFCTPGKPLAAVNHPSPHNKTTAALSHEPRPQQYAPQRTARATADARLMTGVGF